MKRPCFPFRVFYQTVVRVFGILYAALMLARYHGIRNIPAKGPFIVCANHRCVLDPYTVAVAFRQQLYFMAKSELFTDHGPLAAAFLRIAGAFPVHRDSADMQSLRDAESILKRGDVLGIFPQGKVVFDNTPFRPKAGAVLVAAQAGVPIVPVSIWCKGPWRPGKRVTVRIGEPIPASVFAGAQHDRKILRQGAALIAGAINRQLEEGH